MFCCVNNPNDGLTVKSHFDHYMKVEFSWSRGLSLSRISKECISYEIRRLLSEKGLDLMRCPPKRRLCRCSCIDNDLNGDIAVNILEPLKS